MRCNALRQRGRPLGQQRGRSHPLHEPEMKRFDAVDRLAAENQPARDGCAGERGQSLRAAGRRQQPEPHFGQPDHRLGGRDAQIAGQCELEAAAKCGPADFRERDERRGGDAREHALHVAHDADHRLRPAR